jgi:hypothetical protein
MKDFLNGSDDRNLPNALYDNPVLRDRFGTHDH